ncbi:M15 family metallopeptidase [Kineosporia succinea]|uniref:D-alanyl-D-alanine dipeptidase n=1 Tax=Kineosporia succinea TaxID=84632 RepID=A0ABT9P405_9ACTN|nr:M15 family metallopeptidase [Kineosporia succinea]MDP9827426.1 D-alanyl-D-alanine dipeptidase [Kineosporia succinea]
MGTREDVYQLLEEKMLKYADYADVPVIEVDEVVLFEPVPQQGVLRVEHLDPEMSELTGGVVYVRRPVVDMLYRAGQALKALDRSLTLQVVYGFRALEVQTRLFEEAKDALRAQYPAGDELVEAAHRNVAVPSVAGYPTGGAVAVTLLRDEQPVDMGTPVMEANRDSFTFSPFVSREAWESRQLLRRAMMAADFAPFDGEWWHFSYGDKEWARYYRQPGALYDQLAFADAQKVDPSADLAL